MKSRVFIFILVLSAQIVFSKSEEGITPQKSTKDYWSEVPIDFTWLNNAINQKVCAYSQRNFLGCVVAVQYFASVYQKSVQILPVDFVKEQKIIFKAENLALVEGKSNENLTPVERFSYFEKMKNELIQNFFAYSLSYIKNPNQDFEKILLFVSAHSGTKLNNSIYAETVSQFLEVAMDPHTTLYPTKFIQERNQSSGDQFAGVGIEFVRVNQGIVVKRVLKNSGAAKAGVQLGDLVIKANDKNLNQLSEEQVISEIRGPVNSSVKLHVQRENKFFELTIQRYQVSENVVTGEDLVFENKNYTYIRLTHFMYLNTCNEIKNIITAAEAQNTKGYILDLRSNPGGNVDIAACLGGLFLGRNKVITYFEKKSPTGSEYSPIYTTLDQVTKKPMTILINAYSASASEIVSGAFKDHNRAVLVGQTSFGKGSYQGCGSVPQMEQLTICQTGGLFFLPSGVTNQTTGIEPHVSVYKDKEASEGEIYPLREAKMYLFPLKPMKMNNYAANENWNTLKPPLECMKTQDIENLYQQSTSKDIYFHDYQLLNALEVLKCL